MRSSTNVAIYIGYTSYATFLKYFILINKNVLFTYIKRSKYWYAVNVNSKIYIGQHRFNFIRNYVTKIFVDTSMKYFGVHWV